MALIKCPECGSQISDKAAVCPNCGCDPQKVLAEIREKQRLQQKKQRKRIIISITSIFVVGAVAVLAYLYSIDALNTIPSEYRKETESYFDRCKSAIDKGDFEKGTGILGALKTRTLTNRQKKRCEEMNKVLLERGLNDLENTLAAITNNYDYKSMERTKKEITTLKTYQLDASQTERLYLATDRYVELQLGEIEKTVALYKANTQNSSYFEKTNRLAQDLQGMELSTTQKTRLEDAVEEAKRIKRQNDEEVERIKKRKEEERRKREQFLETIKDEYIRLIYNDDCGSNYFLFDINNDTIPELWINASGCETGYRELRVYTFNNGVKLLYYDAIGNVTFKYYEYNNGIVQVLGIGDAYELLTYNGQNIVSRELTKGNMNSEAYIALTRGKRLKLYPSYNTQPILNALGIE